MNKKTITKPDIQPLQLSIVEVTDIRDAIDKVLFRLSNDIQIYARNYDYKSSIEVAYDARNLLDFKKKLELLIKDYKYNLFSPNTK